MTRKRNTLALAFLDKYPVTSKKKPTKVQAKAKQPPKGKQQKTSLDQDGEREARAIILATRSEIIPKAMRAAPRIEAAPVLPLTNRDPFNALYGRELADVLDLSKPEGILDRIFGRPDHRIEVKTKRAERLADYTAAVTRIIEQKRKALEEVSALYSARYAQGSETYSATEHLQYRRNAAGRQDAIEAAKAHAEIAKYQAEAELARRSALPPAPVAIPSHVDEATRQRDESRRIRKDMLDLAREERAERADAAQGLVGDAVRKCEEIYNDSGTMAGFQRERIRKVLDSYGFDSLILPPPLQQLMEEDIPEDVL